MSKLPVVADLGAKIRVKLNQMLKNQSWMIKATLDHIGKEDTFHIENKLASITKLKIQQVLYEVMPDFIPSVATEECGMDVQLLDWWRQSAKDPDSEAVQWLLHGAPGGLLTSIPSCNIFPEYLEEEDLPQLTPEELCTPEDFVNYSGVEESAEAADEMKRLLESGFVACFDDWDRTVTYLDGEEPVLSKIGLIIRERAGKRKIRMVVDSKRSGVSKACKKWQRTQLPTILHAVWDLMELLASCQSHEELEHLIADFKDAFFIVPNKKLERKFFVVLFRGKYYVFLRTAQGSKGAPLTWARVAALITRLTISVLGASETRISTYADDPMVSSVGTPEERNKTFALALLMWGALGLPLSLSKAKKDKAVTWISGTFQSIPGGIRVGIKQELLDDVLQITTEMLQSNLVLKKQLESLDGKLVHISSLVPTVRPFLGDLRAAYHTTNSNAPRDKVWTKQIIHVLLWIKALLTGTVGDFARNYYVAAYHEESEIAEINLDASPWGLGGYLVMGGRIVSWFACQISSTEAKLLDISIGEASSQQVAEALAALVALRAWSLFWTEKQLRIRVRSDSISALILVLRLKTKGKGTSIIAREVALDVAMACYQPAIVEHVPGIANVTCDSLSRKYQPGVAFALPSLLHGVPERVILPREAEFYRTIARPPGTQKAK